MDQKSFAFRLPPGWLVVMLLFLVAPAVTSGAIQLQYSSVGTIVSNLTWLWVFAFIQMAIYRYLMIVVVEQDGINLYRMRTVNWSSIEEAQIRTKMGLDYFYIKSAKGRPHWVPMCFQGEGPDLLEAIRQVAPAGNPVHEVVSSRRWDDRERRRT